MTSDVSTATIATGIASTIGTATSTAASTTSTTSTTATAADTGFAAPLTLPLSTDELARINAHLRTLGPEDILRWAVAHVPDLYQTTAFGLTGLVALDMLARIVPDPGPAPAESAPPNRRPPLIFLDTLHHFPETYALVDDVRRRYGVHVHVYRPFGCATAADFEATYGARLWERDEPTYDWAVKVEPAQRAYRELGVRAVITGRRASQGGARATLAPLEVDAAGLVKVNPLWAWSFADVSAYVERHPDVPRNALLGRGYRSVGDWHSTQPSGDGDDGERAGRWAGRTDKTECGLHVDWAQTTAGRVPAKAE